MIGGFWNIRSVGKKGISTCILDIMAENNMDFIGLLETMKQKIFSKFLQKD